MLTDLAPVPEAGALAVDDASQVADETVLLHLLNTARDRGLAVLLADQAPPARWPVRLPDLGSRLRAITAVGIAAAEDELLRALLVRLLAERQLGIPQPVRDWLSRRLPRSAAALRDAVKVLDRESLESGSTITRPFAARVLHAAGLVADDRHEVSMAPPGATCQIPGML
jgi:chromosomal replication initiation ATPase DnaA